jgi:hypothetical protein
MNRSSSPSAAFVAIVASTLFLAACGAAADSAAAATDPAGGAAGVVTDPAGTGAPAAVATVAQPGPAAASLAPGNGKGGPRRLRHATANGTPHHRRPTHSAPLLYSRR